MSTLNSSGPISLGGNTAGVSVENAIYDGGVSGLYNSSGNAAISLNDKSVRLLAGSTSTISPISLSNIYNQTYPKIFTYSSTATPYNEGTQSSVSFQHTVPSYTNMIIEVWGSGGGGTGAEEFTGAYRAGGGGMVTIVSGTTLTTMTVNGGGGGIANYDGVPGGTSSGGNTLNTTGNSSVATGVGGNGITGSVAGGIGGVEHISSTYQASSIGQTPGGGGGGGDANQASPCGGGGGGYSKSTSTTIPVGSTISISIGIGGLGGESTFDGYGGNGLVIITYY